MSDIKRNIKLIVIDLDGTLLNGEHSLSDRNAEVIKKVIDSGVKVALATGKTRKSAESVLAVLNLDTPGVFVQGLMLYNADGTVKQQSKLDKNVSRKVIQFAESNGFDVVAYSGDRLLARRNEPPVSDLTKYHEPEPQAVGSLVNILDSTIIHKLMIMGGNPRKITKLRWQLNQQVGNDADFTTAAMLTSIEVLPKGGSKGNGVRALAKLIGINAENIMAIGDAENDISMLEFAGFAVAMGNATDALKAVADEVVGTNDDDGVAEAIEKFVLPEEKPETKAEETSEETKAEAPEAKDDEAKADTASTEEKTDDTAETDTKEETASEDSNE